LPQGSTEPELPRTHRPDQDLFEPRLEERRVAVLERGDLPGVGVHAEDVVADVRHARGVHGTQISGPNDGNTHAGPSSTMQHKRSILAIQWAPDGEILGKSRGPP